MGGRLAVRIIGIKQPKDEREPGLPPGFFTEQVMPYCLVPEQPADTCVARRIKNWCPFGIGGSTQRRMLFLSGLRPRE